MARSTLPLTATQIKSAKEKEKDYKLFDGGGLFLLVTNTGAKRWRLKYRINSKEKILALGVYPSILLKDARELREKYKSLVAKGIDPAEEKKQKKEIVKAIELEKENTFYKVAEEWLVSYKNEVSEGYHTDLTRAIEMYIYPFIKNKSITEVTRKDTIEIVQDLKNREIHESAKRTFMLLNKIFMYAVTLEYTPHNIIADIDKKTILGKIQRKHYPTFTKDKDIKGLLLSIDDYSGDYTTKMALKMLPYVFVRSFNIRHCEWSEIDFENKEWIIPAEKMKTKIEFILPLPNNVIEILKEVHEFSGNGKYVFPSFRAKDKPMSDNTLISALRRMGYTKEEFVPHSFRAMFSTIAYEHMSEHGYGSEVIEALLSHRESNKVKEAYNRATYKSGMKKLVEWYSNFLAKITLNIIN